MLRTALLVGVGGFVGSVARYWITAAVAVRSGAHSPVLPVGTLVVNMVGCFAIGALAAAGDARGWLDSTTRPLLITGLLGGFTTYSAFAAETVLLARGGAVGWAVLNVVVQVVLGLALFWMGSRVGTALA